MVEAHAVCRYQRVLGESNVAAASDLTNTDELSLIKLKKMVPNGSKFLKVCLAALSCVTICPLSCVPLCPAVFYCPLLSLCTPGGDYCVLT